MRTISDNERREVARKLREDAADGKLREQVFVDEIIAGCIGETMHDEWGNVREVEILTRLADLIEPEPVTGETSDGFHTFNELYHHRAVLFSVIAAKFADRAWKSKMHADGTMYERMFIVGIETPDGQATYHYDIDPYWDMFRCVEVDCAPEWDGHTPDQAIERIGKLVDCETDRPTCHDVGSGYTFKCSECGCKLGVILMDSREGEPAMTVHDDPLYEPCFCPNCGAEVIKEDSNEE